MRTLFEIYDGTMRRAHDEFVALGYPVVETKLPKQDELNMLTEQFLNIIDKMIAIINQDIKSDYVHTFCHFSPDDISPYFATIMNWFKFGDFKTRLVLCRLLANRYCCITSEEFSSTLHTIYETFLMVDDIIDEELCIALYAELFEYINIE